MYESSFISIDRDYGVDNGLTVLFLIVSFFLSEYESFRPLHLARFNSVMLTFVQLHLYAHYFVHEDVGTASHLSTNVTMSWGFGYVWSQCKIYYTNASWCIYSCMSRHLFFFVCDYGVDNGPTVFSLGIWMFWARDSRRLVLYSI